MSEHGKTGTVTLRFARPGDAGELARIYVESWRETYAGLLPDARLATMSEEHQAAAWRRHIQAGPKAGVVIAAEIADYGLVGLANLGPARDRGLLRFTGEVYALYVDTNFTGRGIGRGLLRASFRLLAERGFGAAVIWALKGNPARWFYEAQGGRPVAEREGRLWGADITEIAFGWDNLAAALGGAQARPRS